MVAQLLPFKCSSILFSWLAVTGLPPTNSIVGMHLSTNPSAFIVCRHFYWWHFENWVAKSFCSLGLHPSNNSRYWALIHVLLLFVNRRVSKTYLFKLFSWKYFPCFELFWPLPTPGHCFRTRVIYSPTIPVNIKWPLALCLKLLLWQKATRRQHFSIPKSGY